MLHLGDITKISGWQVPIVDCVCFGAPCQDISVAGQRKGMKHESMGDDETTRSGLVFDALRIIDEMRDRDVRVNGRSGVDVRPRYAVYENVPGALSSNKGEDFRTILEEIAKIADKDAVIPRPDKWQTSGCILADGYSIAWRILDGQFWGTSSKPLPQRRRRIALVADFGGQSAPEILFVRKSVSGDIKSGEPPRKRTAEDTERGVGTDGCEPILLESNQNHATIQTNGVCTTLSASMGMGGGYVPMITIPAAVGFPLGFRPENVRCYDETATTLCNGTRPGFTTGVIQPLCIEMTSTKNTIVDDGICPTLTARMGTGGNQVNAVVEAHEQQYIVRRLTPLECERLQGYPDGWTDIGEWTDSKGKTRKTSDAARYKALGNSIAIPPWKWVMKRLCACYERDATLASLFDGIGGFPYIWEQLNGKGSCLWASEIEEFPVAVTKARIGW